MCTDILCPFMDPKSFGKIHMVSYHMVGKLVVAPPLPIFSRKIMQKSHVDGSKPMKLPTWESTSIPQPFPSNFRVPAFRVLTQHSTGTSFRVARTIRFISDIHDGTQAGVLAVTGCEARKSKNEAILSRFWQQKCWFSQENVEKKPTMVIVSMTGMIISALKNIFFALTTKGELLKKGEIQTFR